MKTKIFATILLLAISSIVSLAQKFNQPKLDSFMDRLAQKNQAMGSLAISKNGNLIYSRAIGYSFISPNEKIPSNDKTKYRIGSISKMFTATLIFQLIEKGKLELTTTLDHYFQKVQNSDKITIGNLLSHRSGIHNFTDDPDYKTWMTQPKTQAEIMTIISAYKPDFQPDEKTSYSNSNFVILGYIIEKIYKLPYSKVLKEKITSKVGLSNTECGGAADVKKNESFSYQFITDWNQATETDMSIPGGAGAIVSTPADLTKFIESLFSLKLISRSSLDQMKTIKDGIGMGMFQIPFYTRKAYGHNGVIDGFIANLAYFPQDSVAVAYCSNGQVYPINDILIGVLSIYFNKSYPLPTFDLHAKVILSPEDLDRYLGIYSSTQIPLKITITKNGATLMAQATGQPAFPLDAVEKDKFKFDPAGLKMDFNADKKEMTLRQGGANLLFTMDK